MPMTPAQKRAHRAARKAAGDPVPSGGKRARKFDLAEFVGVDGEGADFAPDDHRYILMSMAHSGGETYSISDPAGLSPDRCLQMLTRAGARWPNAVMCVFSGGYDTTMLLRRLLSEVELAELWSRVRGEHPDGSRLQRCGRWLIGYQPRRQLYIHDTFTGNKCTLWDVWGYFQASFVRTLQSWMPEYEQLELITTQKARRGEFDPSEMPLLQQYCEAECRALVTLMHQLHARMVDAGVRVNRWDGAGSIAAALLRDNGVKEHMAPTPDHLMPAVQSAYFGGRSELLRYGTHTGPIYQYDINSAYPSAMRDLPSLASGEWAHHVVPLSTRRPTGFAVVRIAWDLQHKDGGDVYPFPYRNGAGAVSYPPAGTGWVWMPELDAYHDHASCYAGTVTVLEWYALEPATEARPFGWVADLYSLRQQWHAAGNPAQIIIKLGLNSLYGKTAQQVGSVAGQSPAWHQLEWAGWVTSLTRARLYRATMQQPGEAIMLASDAIYSTAPLDLPGAGAKRLGEWSADMHDGGTFVQAGVYWLSGADEQIRHARGFGPEFAASPEPLTRERVTLAWQQTAQQWRAVLSCTAPRVFVGIGMVVSGLMPYRLLGSWQTLTRTLQLYPTGKRTDIPLGWQDRRPSERLVPTLATPLPDPARPSTPYPLAYLDQPSVQHERRYLRRALVEE